MTSQRDDRRFPDSSADGADGTRQPGPAERIDEAETWFNQTFEQASSPVPGAPYAHYRPAYRYGIDARSQHGTREWDETLDAELQADWHHHRGSSPLDWAHARPAVQEAYQAGSAGSAAAESAQAAMPTQSAKAGAAPAAGNASVPAANAPASTEPPATATERVKFKHYTAPSGGWGSVHSLARHGLRRGVPTAAAAARGDATEVRRGDIDFQLLPHIHSGSEAAGGENVDLLVGIRDPVPDNEGRIRADVPLFGIDANAHLARRTDALARGRKQSGLKCFDHRITLDPLLFFVVFEKC